MRYIDFDWLLSPRTYENLVALERASRLIARLVPALALVGVLVTGIWLFSLHDPTALLSHSTLRGLHLMAGMILLLDIGFSIGRWLVRVVRDWEGWPGWPDRHMLMRIPPPRPTELLEWSYWGVLGMMVLTGLLRILSDRYGIVSPLITPAFGWGVLHGLLSKYFLALLMLRVFFYGTRGARWLGQYLREP